ncbi:MAG TPA: hypothetical protein VKN74_00535 [Candidatus Mcinerneyibacterium sp.]|nr:hypothetical protein [Candidatus Mcinerneyibacterium sp.]
MQRKITILLMVLSIIISLPVISEAKTGDKYRLHGKRFYIQSAKTAWRDSSKGFWDLPGGPEKRLQSNVQLQVWNFEKAKDRFYTFYHLKGDYYKIRVGYRGKYLYYGRPWENGQKVKTGPGRIFKVKYLGNSKWKILNRNGKWVVCLAGRSYNDGTDIHLWEDHNVTATKWVFRSKNTRNMYTPPKIRKKASDNAGNLGSGNNENTGNSYINLKNNRMYKAVKYSASPEDYFRRVSYSNYKRDYIRMKGKNSMIDIINNKKKQDQWKLIMNMVNGASKNDEANVRNQVYYVLQKVNIKKASGFSDKILYISLKKVISNARNTEKHKTVKARLSSILRKM